MWLNASASDGENGAPRRPSPSTLLKNGVKNRARELRSAATVLPARLRGFFADLGGMAEATEMVTGLDSRLLVPCYAGLIVSLLFWSSYRRIARSFKWLTFVLLAYIGAGILADPDWHTVLRATVVPHVTFTPGYIATFVGILGTTISPYLFFW